MGIRETINKRKDVGFAVGALACAGSVVLLFWSSSSGIPSPLKQTYYSDDEGQTYFADDIAKVYPFDHSGKEADRAFVYKGADGKPYVGYLERYSKSGLAKLAAPVAGVGAVNPSTDLEVKKPGESRWVSEQSREGIATANPRASDGRTPLTAIFP